MNNIFISFTINILLLIFAIFPLLDIIYERSDKKKHWQKITKKGWNLILLALLIVAFNFYKDFEGKKKQEASEQARHRVDSLFQSSQLKILQLQITSKDSIIKEVKNTYANSIKSSNEALAKYNLRITDSLHSVIDKLKLNAVTSQLLVAPLSKGTRSIYVTNVEGQNKLNIKFISKGGTSYHILLTCYYLEQTYAGYSILGSVMASLGESYTVEDVVSTKAMDIPAYIFKKSNVVVFVTGSFTRDFEGKRIIPFNLLFKYNFKENKLITALETNFKKLKSELNIK